MSEKFWSGIAGVIDTSGGTSHIDISDPTVNPPCTLLRSLVWVLWQGYEEYDIGAHGVPLQPRGWGFGDLNARSNTGSGPTTSPADPGVDLIAADVAAPQFAALGWPPNVTSDLSGSVNSIDSSATIAETWNLNTFMYASARSYVDSHAQRSFFSEPQYRFSMWNFAISPLVVRGASRMIVAARLLYNQSPG